MGVFQRAIADNYLSGTNIWSNYHLKFTLFISIVHLDILYFNIFTPKSFFKHNVTDINWHHVCKITRQKVFSLKFYSSETCFVVQS